ncbi:Phosphoglycerate dehydrogenase [Ruania alba]|uniref:Phosphoglycerate dehydrogenase n=2 Tax=Ruania alba TaxID=648782 RepID=A0A1H5HLY4_9MICO|nr:Phosphoglycerate dehydrogenase [Ruania alba]
MNEHAWSNGFGAVQQQRLRAVADLGGYGCVSSPDQLPKDWLQVVEVLITGWGAPQLTHHVLDATPRLRLVAHAAGSVKAIATPECLDRGIIVTSAAAANAIPVAEFTFAAVIMAAKRVFSTIETFRAQRTTKTRPTALASAYGRTVGIIGFSRIGRRVVALLRNLGVNVLVADPYADRHDVHDAGAALVELDDLLRRADIVSVHAPATPATRHMLDAERLALIPDAGTVINTARGSLIEPAALERECVSGRLSAILDVTEPEPLPPGSPLWDLPNVTLTPHLAGAQTTEVRRLADAALDELAAFARGEAPVHPVPLDELDRLA